MSRCRLTARSCLALLAAALLLAGCGASDAGEGTGTSSSDTSSPTGQASASGQPRARASAPECVAKHRDDTDACILDSAEGMGTPAMRAAAERARAATLVDLTDVVCPGGTCRPVFGNVLVQRDGSHLTDTFVRAAAPALEAPLRDLVTGSR